jgi:hypothetical protein
VPPEIEWFASIFNLSARRAYENAIQDFMRFAGALLWSDPQQPHRPARQGA